MRRGKYKTGSVVTSFYRPGLHSFTLEVLVVSHDTIYVLSISLASVSLKNGHFHATCLPVCYFAVVQLVIKFGILVCCEVTPDGIGDACTENLGWSGTVIAHMVCSPFWWFVRTLLKRGTIYYTEVSLASGLQCSTDENSCDEEDHTVDKADEEIPTHNYHGTRENEEVEEL